MNMEESALILTRWLMHMYRPSVTKHLTPAATLRQRLLKREDVRVSEDGSCPVAPFVSWGMMQCVHVSVSSCRCALPSGQKVSFTCKHSDFYLYSDWNNVLMMSSVWATDRIDSIHVSVYMLQNRLISLPTPHLSTMSIPLFCLLTCSSASCSVGCGSVSHIISNPPQSGERNMEARFLFTITTSSQHLNKVH